MILTTNKLHSGLKAECLAVFRQKIISAGPLRLVVGLGAGLRVSDIVSQFIGISYHHIVLLLTILNY